MIEVPLFPLHAVLCPGMSMPLHVFEPRYRALVRQCLAENAPFGVVLIREGREIGGGSLAVAEVGTFAEIREASRFADGRFDLVAHGAGRFRLHRVIVGRDPFLVGVVDPVPDELGDPDVARELAVAVTRRFIRYLELLQPGESEGGGEEVVLGIESGDPSGEVSDEPTARDLAAIEAEEAADAVRRGGAQETLEISSAELTIPDEPTTLSYLLTGIVELDLPRRQALLEASTTEVRLAALAAVLEREIDLLGRRLRMYVPDPRTSDARRN